MRGDGSSCSSSSAKAQTSYASELPGAKYSGANEINERSSAHESDATREVHITRVTARPDIIMEMWPEVAGARRELIFDILWGGVLKSSVLVEER